MLTMFTRTLEILDHILKRHPILDSRYSTLASLAKTQMTFTACVISGEKRLSKKALNGVNTRPVQAIEAELSQFEERLLSVDQQISKWMQDTQENNKNITKELGATEGYETEDTGQSQSQRWRKYPGVWKPRSIGIL